MQQIGSERVTYDAGYLFFLYCPQIIFEGSCSQTWSVSPTRAAKCHSTKAPTILSVKSAHIPR